GFQHPARLGQPMRSVLDGGPAGGRTGTEQADGVAVCRIGGARRHAVCRRHRDVRAKSARHRVAAAGMARRATRIAAGAHRRQRFHHRIGNGRNRHAWILVALRIVDGGAVTKATEVAEGDKITEVAEGDKITEVAEGDKITEVAEDDKITEVAEGDKITEVAEG